MQKSFPPPHSLSPPLFRKKILRSARLCPFPSVAAPAPSPFLSSSSSLPNNKMPVTRVIILPGNGAGDVRAPGCNWYAWMERTLKKEFGDEVHVALENMPDPVTARRELWLPFTREKMGADEHTVVLGHSSGAVAAVRLAEETKLYGIILVGVCHTDLGDANERASNYYPLPDGSNQWRWEQAVANTNFVSIFASADDPFLPYSEQEHVRDQLCKKEGSKFFGFPAEEGRGHWQDEHQKEILQHTIKVVRESRR